MITTVSPIIYIGGKSRLAPKIIERMPSYKTYVEVFEGVAHVIVQKPPSAHEIYNDIDTELVNFLLVAGRIRSGSDRLARRCHIPGCFTKHGEMNGKQVSGWQIHLKERSDGFI